MAVNAHRFLIGEAVEYGINISEVVTRRTRTVIMTGTATLVDAAAAAAAAVLRRAAARGVAFRARIDARAVVKL